MNLWSDFRPIIIEHFPKSLDLSEKGFEYLKELKELYVKDAYNSLSIEGFQVDAELIQGVCGNDWDSDCDESNALAARGYYEAFLEVEKTVAKILEGESSGEIIAKELQQWVQKLFSPSVQAGILKPTDLLGYRRHQVYIRNSCHVPFPREALLDGMEALFDCLKNETHPGVRAVLGHFFFVYIHPYMDGNGRLGRFIMNAMLASGGYPWTVIQVRNRSRYLAALEKASVDQDIVPFTLFVAEEMQFS
jgi:Fic family protein